MRLMSHILAVVLAISSIAVPCLAKVQGSSDVIAQHVGPPIVTDSDKCSGPCAKAIASRESHLDQVAVVVNAGFNAIAKSVEQVRFPIARNASVNRPAKALCVRSVDLYVLCRLLN